MVDEKAETKPEEIKETPGVEETENENLEEIESSKKEEPVEKKPAKEPTSPQERKKSDFKYIVRIADTDIDGNKKIIHGLTQIKGIGRHMAILVADAAGINREMKCGSLNDEQLDNVREVLKNLNKKAPSWMLNHRKDYDTGEDIHLISSDVDLHLRDEINLLKMIRSYRGIRHELGLTVRGQRTRSNNRKGLALGVSKKRK